MKILIFGGTGEARELANGLVAAGHEVMTSLAGRTENPLQPEGQLRSGGFGGVENILGYIADEGFDWVVDATHPYAQSMSGQLAEVAQSARAGFVRLLRAPWGQEGGVNWRDMAGIAEAIAQLPVGARALVTTGHEEIDALAGRDDCRFFLRLIEKPVGPMGENTTLIVERPPYELHGELSLMREFSITHLLTKNAGGAQTRAKLDAAAQLGVEIFMVARPALPHVPNQVQSVSAAMQMIQDAVS